MPIPFQHDKGISRLACNLQVHKGDWYFGFICTECGAKIFALTNEKKVQTHPIAVGDGLFSVPCRACDSDEIIHPRNGG